MEQDRRETLRILGAISTTCAFPFSSGELYGQHVHSHSIAAQAALPAPSFFTAAELATLTAIADLIIPATDTPAASGAGVPAYMDFVCSRNAELARTVREGLRTVPTPVTEQHLAEWQAAGSPFFRAVKNLTADGYYTSKTGLIDELGYRGNQVLESFPTCEIPEH